MKKIIILSLLAVMFLVLAGCAVQQPEGLPPPADSDAALVGQGFATGSYDRTYQFYNTFRLGSNYVSVNLVKDRSFKWLGNLRLGDTATVAADTGEVTITVLPRLLEVPGSGSFGARLLLDTACSDYAVEFNNVGDVEISAPYDGGRGNLVYETLRVPVLLGQPLRQIRGTNDAITIHSTGGRPGSRFASSWFTLHCDVATAPTVSEVPSGLTNCGNRQVDSGEACDDGNTRNGDGCNSRCQVEARCGDGVREGSEQCDDGNTRTEDFCPYGQRSCTACNADCTQSLTNLALTYCGDGFADPAHGNSYNTEICDDGMTDGFPVTETSCPYGQKSCTRCNQYCTEILRNLPLSYCGDGTEDTINGEVCDDGNEETETACPLGVASCITCRNDCKEKIVLTTERRDLPGFRAAVCGNGLKEGSEACDDGNTNSEGSCPYGQKACLSCSFNCERSLSLTGPVCGDGSVDQSNGETCDDGNIRNDDGCNSQCQREIRCGDGVREGSEQCDDGNQINADACTNQCRNPACGDGILQRGEICDGNVFRGSLNSCSAVMGADASGTLSCINNCKAIDASQCQLN